MSLRQLKKTLLRFGFWCLIGVLLLYAVFPFYYAIVTSLKPSSALFEVSYWIHNPDFSNYATVLHQASFLRAIANSLIVSLCVVTLALFLSVTAAYALGRVKFRGRGTVLMMVLGVSMFPQVAVLSGLFEVIRALGLYNTSWALSLSYTIFTLPFTVWVLTTFMGQLPHELEEAAIMDGASPWVTLTRVLLPLLWPALVTTGLLAFIAAWNEFLFALTFTLTDAQRTVPVASALISSATASARSSTSGVMPIAALQSSRPWSSLAELGYLVVFSISLMVISPHSSY